MRPLSPGLGRSLLALPLATLERPLLALRRWKSSCRAALGVLRRRRPHRRAHREDILGAPGGVLTLHLSDLRPHELVELGGRAGSALLLFLLDWFAVRIQQQGAGAPLPQGDAARRRENLGDLLRSLCELREGRRQLAHFHVGTCGVTTLPRW